MKYKSIKQYKQLNRIKNNNLISYIFKWVNKKSDLRWKKIFISDLKQKQQNRITNRFQQICYISWRSKSVINPLLLSKTTFRFFVNNNWLSGFQKK